jgi:FtsH-binding integral membrane protein
MEDLALKNRLSVLWLINGVGGLATIVLDFYEPNVIDQIRSGEKGGPGFLFLFSILLLFPLVMAFLCQTLKDKANRRVNIIMGAVNAVLVVVVLLTYLIEQSVLAIGPASGIVFSALIIWYAYNWSKS